MSCWFKSDNTAGIAPQVLDAIARESRDPSTAYGDDATTRALEQRLAELFEHDVRAFPVITGTAANALSLATLTPRWGAVLAHEQAHVLRDESTASEFFTGGARLIALRGSAGRIAPEALQAALVATPVTVHTIEPAVLTLTQCTELGTCYHPDQIRTLSAIAREHRMRVHMDGSRFANAVAFLGVTPADVTWRAGVDVLSFGGTKNGAMGAEVVVFFDVDLARDFERHRKRAGHLLSKSRFVSVQLLALLREGLWLDLARRANAGARRIGAVAGSRLLHPVEANEVFVSLGHDGIEALRREPAGFLFYDWGGADSGEARFVVSWDQRSGDVDRLCEALERLFGSHDNEAPAWS